MKMDIVNLEAGSPTVDEAMNRVSSAVPAARRRGISCIKLIHGYGSSGAGGAIRQAMPAFLAAQKSRGLIRDYAVGTDFSASRDAGIRIARIHPDLKKDRDYKMGNEGISIIIL